MAAALESYITESIGLLLVVAAAAALLVFAARRAGVARVLGPVELLARLPLEPRRCVYVVRVADRVLILGSSEAGLAKLGELPEGALPRAPESVRSGLSGWLERRPRPGVMGPPRDGTVRGQRSLDLEPSPDEPRAVEGGRGPDALRWDGRSRPRSDESPPSRPGSASGSEGQR